MPRQKVSSWGRLAEPEHGVAALSDSAQLPALLRAASLPGLAYGNGRSYGDVCLNAGGTLWTTRGLDRFIAFDRDAGVIECEAGVLLKDIIDLVLPQGWFLPVVPGTQFVTVGGAIANDVHGKSHHRQGSFGDHVERLTLVRTYGTVLTCGPHELAEWFAATVGGMGLTGVIASARLRLRRVDGPWLDAETLVFDSLDRFFELSAESAADWEHTVSWIDCVGGRGGNARGVFFRGNHGTERTAVKPRAPRTFPFTPPLSLINGLSLRLFNQIYYNANRWRAGRGPQHYLPFFFPLDNLLEWNRVYGPRGFYQYQCVVPPVTQKDAVRELLRRIGASGTGSFLAVLKTFGERPSPGLLSFPMPGTTLALDFPNLGARTLKLFDELNAVVTEAGGRLYSAKDACMPRALFERGYPRLAEFKQFRDPGLSSDMARRLLD
jgi:FAD/FMN-containing dehydrogenase